MVSSNIIKLLDYIRNSELPINPSPLVMKMHKEFESLKNDNSVWRDYMNSIEHDEEIRAEGKAEGKAESKLEIAKNLKKKGILSTADIAEATGLSIEEIERL